MNDNERRTAEGILFTDFYQFTMAQLYFRAGLHERDVQFDHFYRRNPDYDGHQAGFCVAAGLETLLDWMQQTRFRPEDIDYLRSQRSSSGKRLFEDDFLGYLAAHGDFSALTLRAVPEGRVVHPNTPLTVVQGPLAMAQILETALLNKLNYQTLIATKAQRIFDTSGGRSVLEFGVRRAQGKGANEGTRAALIGGANFSSNVGMSKLTGLAPKGTHAHSMVQLFMALGMGELGAFQAYADLYPDDCLLLVDTVDTLGSGVPNAIRVFETLRRKGHRPVGIRLDSGDQAYLSIQAAKLLDEAGFPETVIVLSSDLDEMVIWQILTQIRQEAPRYGLDARQLSNRLVFGVGTRLITSWGEPALGGVYKLVAVRDGADWDSAIKISDSPSKTPNPGHKGLWRIYDQRGKATADLVGLWGEEPAAANQLVLRHPMDHTKMRTLGRAAISSVEPLLSTVWEQGKPASEAPPLDELRRRRSEDVDRLDPGVRRLVNPHIYHVSLSKGLWDLKQELIAAAWAQNTVHEEQ